MSGERAMVERLTIADSVPASERLYRMFVKDLVLRRAITQAYAGIVPKDRYPVVIVEVLVPPSDVDVNVHPAKTEVRFQHAWDLQNAVAEGLRNALQEHGIRRPVQVEARYLAPPAPVPVKPPGLEVTV